MNKKLGNFSTWDFEFGVVNIVFVFFVFLVLEMTYLGLVTTFIPTHYNIIIVTQCNSRNARN